jgi:hypothetical protein
VPIAAGWSGRWCERWSACPEEQVGPGGLPWPGRREVQGYSSGGGRDPGRDGDELASDCRGGRLGQPGTFVNALLSAQADAVCGAGYGERSDERVKSPGQNGVRERAFESLEY